MSNYLKNLNIGDTIEIQGPKGSFQYSPDFQGKKYFYFFYLFLGKYQKLYMIAGGKKKKKKY